MRAFFTTVSFLLSITFISCFEDPDCTKLKNDKIVLGFFKEKDGQEKDEIALSGVKISGTTKELNSGETVDQIIIPLNFSVDEQEIIVDLSPSSPSSSYEITIRYKVKIQFIHEQCEARRVFSDLEIVRHDFSFAEVINSLPQQEGGTLVNIQIVR